MDVFWTTILSFPTVIFTGMLGLSMVYWLLVIVGALDLDSLDVLGGSAEGVAEGAAEAAGEAAGEALGEGAAEALGDGAAEALGDGAAEAAGDALAEGAAEGGAVGLLSVLRLRRAPVTVTFSLVSLFAWLFSVVGMEVAGQLPVSLPTWLLATANAAVSFVAGVGLTSLALRPFDRAFASKRALAGHSLVGQTCRVTMGEVDEGFGQARLEDGGAGLVLQIRCKHQHRPNKGDEVLIVSYAPDRHVYWVEALSAPDKKRSPVARAQSASQST